MELLWISLAIAALLILTALLVNLVANNVVREITMARQYPVAYLKGRAPKAKR